MYHFFSSSTKVHCPSLQNSDIFGIITLKVAKMKIFSIKIKTFLIISCLSLALPIFFDSSASAAKVSCGPLNGVDKAICEASLQKCGDTDSDKDKACRKGFREGAKKNGDEMRDTCTGSNKSECETGYRSGKSQKDDLNKASTTVAAPPGTIGSHQCGNLSDKDENVKTKINFGCLGTKAPAGTGPIEDIFFAIIRFLSNGVGIMMVIALIAAGIQYTTSEGNAEQTMKSKRRIQMIVLSLFIYLFTYAILQFLIPGGIFKR